MKANLADRLPAVFFTQELQLLRIRSQFTCACSVVLLMIIVSSAAQISDGKAQESTTSSAPRHPRGRGKTLSLDERVKRFATALDLNETQQEAVKGILEKRHQRVTQIVSSRTLSGSERISMLRNLEENTVTQIRSVLNEEQKKKYDPFGHRSEISPPETSLEDWLKATTPKQ